MEEPARQPTVEAPRLPRRRGLDLVLSLIVFLLALAGYLRTMRPTFGWGDSSELTTAAYYLGVGHSPGYPTWMLLAHPFARLPVGEVAFRVNFFTALLGAVAIALLYLVCRTIARSRVAGFIAALTFAFSATFWDQTTEAEVYTLHVCLASLILLIALTWRSTRADRWLYLLAWLVGISLGNHALTALMIPALFCFVWAERGLRFFTRRRILSCAGLFLLGLSVYAYLPIRGMADPAPHLNNPHNFAQFWAQVTAPGARQSMFSAGLLLPLQRAFFHCGRLTVEFGWLGFALALFGIERLWRGDRSLTILLALIALLDVAYSVNFSIFDIYVYFLPLHLVWAAFIAVGIAGVVELLAAAIDRIPRRHLSPSRIWRCGPAAALLMALPLMQFTDNLRATDGSDDYASELFARAVFRQVEPGSVVLGDWWAIAPLGYLKYIEGERSDVTLYAAAAMYQDEAFLHFADPTFLRSYPAVYFVEVLTYRTNLLRDRTYLVPEGPVTRVLVDRPDRGDVLADIPLTPTATFGDRIALVRADVQSGVLRAGESLDFTLYWNPLSGYDGSSHEAIYFLQDPDGIRVWWETNLLGHDLYPLDQWRAGEVLVEPHSLYLAKPIPPGSYDLFVRVRERGRSHCLPCDRAADPDNLRDYRIAQITVGAAQPLPSRARIPKLVALLRPSG